MSQISWEAIRIGKKVYQEGSDLLVYFFKTDSFDVGFGNFSADDWLLMARDASSKSRAGDKSAIRLAIGLGAESRFIYDSNKSKNSEL